VRNLAEDFEAMTVITGINPGTQTSFAKMNERLRVEIGILGHV